MDYSVLGSPVLADYLLLPRNSKMQGPQLSQSPMDVLPTPTTLYFPQIPLYWLLSIPQDHSLKTSAHLHRKDLPQGKEEGMHVDVRVFAEAIGLGMVLEVHVVPPAGRGPLQRIGDANMKT